MLPLHDMKSVNLQDYFNIVRRRWWIPVVCLSIAFAIGFATKAPEIKRYRASAMISVEEHPVLGTMSLGGFSWKIQKRDMNVLMEQWQSRDFAERVAKRIDEENIYLLRQSVQLSLVGGDKRRASTNLITISAIGMDPEQVTLWANAWAESVVQHSIDIRMEISDYGAQWLANNRKNVLTKFHAAEKALMAFKQNYSDVPNRAVTLKKWEAKRNSTEDELNELLVDFKERHPRVEAVKKHLRMIDERIIDTRGNSLINDRIIKYRLLEGQVAAYSSLYDKISKAASEAEITRGLILPGIQIISRAEVPTVPLLEKQGNFQNVIAVGFIVGIGLCFLLEYLDTTIKKEEEVELYVKLPFMGALPRVEGWDKEDDRTCLVLRDKHSELIETIQKIKISLLFASSDGERMKTTLVTSAQPKEGKTFIASNLAIVFSQAGEKTLLIDSDLRKGSLHRVYGVDGGADKGLSDFLMGEATTAEVVYNTAVPNLSLLPSGSHVINAGDLLMADRIKDMMTTLKEKYQHIVVDLPPVLKYLDAVLWEEHADGLLLVIRAKHTVLADITKVHSAFKKISFAGAALNNMDKDKNIDYYFLKVREALADMGVKHSGQ